MRITALSNSPWSLSGYGNQMKLLLPRLVQKGHAISLVAYHGHAGAPQNWNGIHIYGMATDPYGMDAVAAYATDFGADFVLSNMDIWVIKPEQFMDKKWVAWIPVDSDPMPPMVEQNARKAWHRIIWTKFAASKMDEAGLDYDRVPYGIDTKNFFPGDKDKARETARMPRDKFIVGMVGMNKGYPCRKAFFENIAAFKYFNDKHPDSYLYLHTQDGTNSPGGMVDLLYYCRRVGLKPGENVGFADQYSMLIGYSEDQMNTIYNCMDVHMLVSMGEGFCLPMVEAQSAGVPVIYGDWTAMSELGFSGWKVNVDEAIQTYTLLNTYQFTPLVSAIADRLEQAYKMHGNEEYSKRARQGAEKYDIDRVVEKYWVPTLAKIEARLKDEPDSSVAKNLDILR